MPLYALNNKTPVLTGDTHFIAPTASIVGDVLISNNVSVWFSTVIRAENDRVVIGEGSNIQDGAVLHVDPGFPLNIGENVTVGHQAMLHGCTIGDGSLIGIQAVILNGAVIGKGSLIGANALVTENMQIPDNSLVLGSPAKVIKTLSDVQMQALKITANNYITNAQRFNAELTQIDE